MPESSEGAWTAEFGDRSGERRPPRGANAILLVMLGPPRTPSTPRSLCIVKLGAIGDVVNSLPLVCRLRDGLPETRITWVIAPLAHARVAGHECVDEFLVLDVKDRSQWRPALRRLRALEFDLVLDLQRILKSGVITRLTGAPRRLGFDRARTKELSWLFGNERIPANPTPGVTVAQYLEFADHLGLPPAAPEWRLPDEAWSGSPPRVALGIGASKPANLWASERWSELLARLAAKYGAGKVALVGGPGDRSLADKILDGAPEGVLDTVGALTLKETAGLLRASEVFVACDTGPLHMAVAVGTQVVALFGAADPARTGPYLQPEAVLYDPAPCSPCRKRECFVAGHPCMNQLEVPAVQARIAALLD